jgi:hypothetical protein
MTIRCKHCDCTISLTEAESSHLAADLDRKYSWDEQASLTFKSVCGDCWPAEYDRMAEAVREGRLKVHVIPGAV